MVCVLFSYIGKKFFFYEVCSNEMDRGESIKGYPFYNLQIVKKNLNLALGILGV